MPCLALTLYMRNAKDMARAIRAKSMKMAEGGSVPQPKPQSPDHGPSCKDCGGPISKEEADKFAKGLRGYSEGGSVLDNEPLGDEWDSDEFLATPKGEAVSSTDSMYDPETEDESTRIAKVMRQHRRNKLISR